MAKRKGNKKSSKKPTKSELRKRFEERKKKAAENYRFNKDKQDTIHNAKNILLDFFNDKDSGKKKGRISKAEVSDWQNKKKALYKFNKIIRDKRIELENKIRSGREVKKSDLALKLKEKVELQIPKSVRNTLDTTYSRIFKSKGGFYLKEISYFTPNNKINYYSGKSFYFVLDTGFKKHYIKESELKKKTVLSEFDLTRYLLDIYKKDFSDFIKEDASKKRSQKEFKLRQKVYSKIRKAIEHNEAILSGTTRKVVSKDKEGEIDRSEGEYPIMFEMYDELIEMMIP